MQPVLDEQGEHREGGPESGTTTDVLDRSLITGLAWTAAAKWSTQILSWLSTLIVARLLVPDDYGLMGMATVYVGLVQLIKEFGLGAAIVHKRDLDEAQIAQLGGVAVGFGAGLLAVSLFVAEWVAELYSEPLVANVIRVLSITFLTSAFQVIPRSIMMRDLEYKRLAVVDGVEALSAVVTTLLLATLGAGVWALIVGSVVARFVATLLANLMRPFPIRVPRSFASVRSSLVFGGQVVTAQLAWWVHSNADIAIIGRLLGKTVLGAYTIAYTLATVPLERVNALFAQVLPGIFSQVQKDRALLRRYIVGVSEAVSLLTFPAAVGMAFVAEDFVNVVLGERWVTAVPPLQILALAGAFRSLGPVLAQALVYVGQPRRNTEYSVLAALVLTPLFVVGTRWGAEGVALVVLAVQPLVSIPTMYRHAFRAAELSFQQYVRALWPASSSSVLMLILLILFNATWFGQLSSPLRLGLNVGLGAVAYSLALIVLHRDRLARFVGTVRGRGLDVPADPERRR